MKSTKKILKSAAATLACAFALGIAPIANESIPSLTLTASAASYSVVYPAEGVDYFIACESNTNYVVDLYGGGTDTYSNFNVYEKNGSGAQIFTLKRVDGDWYEIIHKESGKCINVVRGESYDDARLWLYPYYSNDYASQFRFAAAGDSYIIQNRLDTQRILDLHDNIAYSGAKLHLWSLHDGQSGRWKLIPANTSSNSSNNSYSNFCNGTYKVNSWDGVNVRSGAGTGYSWVGTALNGTTFKVSKTSGDWGYTDSIKTNAGWKSGWLCLAYCDIQNDNSSSSNNSSSNFNNGTYKVNSWDGVNVRSGAGTGYSWVGTALNGTTFKVSKTSGDWGYTDSIKTNAGWKSGWLCLTYCNITSDSGNDSYNQSWSGGQSSSGMQISSSGLDFICGQEGFHSTCYRDATQNSIGYGTRCGSSMHASGTHSITREQAKAEMEQQINSKYAPRVRNQTSGLYLTQNQFDALVSLSYNTGGGNNMIANSPLVKYLKGNLTKSEAIAQYKEYAVYSNGVKLSGLVRRRTAEANLFFS